jgi:SSS family solute:Na+ symporter
VEKKMLGIKKNFTIGLLLFVPFAASGQEVDSTQQTTVEWRQMTDAASGDDPLARPVLAGAFVGVHNDALIVAGGIDDGNRDNTWVATRDSDGVVWHDTKLGLPGNRAFGASASNALGVFAIGGSDGSTASSDVTLIRWDQETSRPHLFNLPAMPVNSVNGGAAIIANTLYLVSGSDGTEQGNELYAFDLARIQTDETGRPLATDGDVSLLETTDEQGRAVRPWQQLPSLPISDRDLSARTDMLVVAQNNGRGGRLYVIAGHSESTQVWEYDPDAAAWTGKARASVDGRPVAIDGGGAVSLGQSHVLLLTGPNDVGSRGAFSYNAITNVWAAYNDAPPQSDFTDGGVVSTQAIHWQDDIVVVGGSVDGGTQQIGLWTVDVNGPTLTFGWLNMSVLVVYLLSMVMVGVYFVFKNSTTDDYFRGGQNIPWWAAACSIYATMLSSLTYVALPALVYRTDWLIYIGTMMILVVAPVAIYIAMPFFRQIDATSAYEYLSKRFNMPVRLFASGLFTLFHIGRMGIVLALTALALAAVTPLDAWQSVLVMGVLSLIYCTLGGVEAVIWTDTIQTVVLLIGAVLCFVIIMGGVDGGFAGFIESGLADDKFKLVNVDFGSGSIMTLSIWVIVLGGIGQNISSYTADQAVVQRYMTTKDTRAAAKSIWANGILAVPGALLFFCIGTGLYAFYKSQPEKLDPTIQIDQIFPTFIGAELPVGIAGLIVAGIFAAAQSTVSTSMNSIATTIVTDFMRPFNACRSEKAYLNAARLLTFTMGVIGTLAGLLFISPEIRSLMEEYFKVIGMFMGALGGLFVLGVTTRKANGWGALVGIFAGVVVMITVWLMEWADGYLFATIGILTCLLVGYLASLLLPAEEQDLAGLTLYTMQDR